MVKEAETAGSAAPTGAKSDAEEEGIGAAGVASEEEEEELGAAGTKVAES